MKNYLLLFTTFSFVISSAQERKQSNDTLDTQTINVVKPYVPSVSDAFRVNVLPKVKVEDYETTERLNYKIFSVPVASTFSPDKGAPQKVKKVNQKRSAENYFSLAAGNYFNVKATGFIGVEIDKSSDFWASINHNSSAGGIDDVVLKDAYSDSNLSLGYDKSFKSGEWQNSVNVNYGAFNWYGIDPNLNATAPKDLDVSHAYFGTNFLSKYVFKEGVFKTLRASFNFFGDSHDASESRLKSSGDLQFILNNQNIDLTVAFDRLKGEFKSGVSSSYNNLLFGLSPVYNYDADFFNLKAGIQFNYLNESDVKSKIYIAPNIKFSYDLVEGYLSSYVAVKGGVGLNSYEEVAEENPYLTPNLFLTPTITPYDATIGLRGLFTESIGFGVSSSYRAENNKLFFISNGVNPILESVYDYGNAFSLIYDDLKTLSFSGDISMRLGGRFDFIFKGSYNFYNTDQLQEAFNLSPLNLSMIANCQINKSWAIGASAFYIGTRKDFYSGVMETAILDLEAYFDLNLKLDYQYNKNWNFFVNGQNLLAGSYQKWNNYPVQDIQFLAGAKYQFDF